MHSPIPRWDDLRHVLAVAEHGSISAAARVLGVNHATVLRRVAAFELAHGGAVFERTAQGYRVLPERARVIEAAREAAASIDTVSRLMRGKDAGPAPRVRLATTDSLAQLVMPRLAAELSVAAQPLVVEIMASNEYHDLGRLEADVVVRPARRLPPGLVGEVAAHLGFRAWRAPAGAARWLHHGGTLARSEPGRWLAERLAEDGTDAPGADSFLVLAEMVRAGLGQAYLPAIATPPGLVAVDGAPAFEVPVWVASRADMAGLPRIRQARRAIAAGLERRRNELAGARGRSPG